MKSRIIELDTWARRIPSPRMDFKIGAGQSVFPEWMRINVEVRVQLRSSDGRTAWGCSADWPSFGWLDKRAEVTPRQKLSDLLNLVQQVRDVYRSLPDFESPFACWWHASTTLESTRGERPLVPLCLAFAHALFERALIDAWCRMEQIPFHRALSEGRLGLELGQVHPELAGHVLGEWLPAQPRERVFLRHTVGSKDPLTEADLDPHTRLGDRESWTLHDYLRREQISYLKIKVCGDPGVDLPRLQQIWVLVRDRDPHLTLDGNEAFANVAALRDFITQLAKELPEFFARILYIEQPLDRRQTLEPDTADDVHRLAQLKPLIIDEADGPLHAFRDAIAIGYRGVSHKNCKGLFKSLANFALARARSTTACEYFLSSEDLTNLPPVALPQDFAVVAALGLTHAERNGHHFFRGLAHLTPPEQTQALTHYPRLYERRGNDTFLRIVAGQVDLSNVNDAIGLGVAVEPDWSAMVPLAKWLSEFEVD